MLVSGTHLLRGTAQEGITARRPRVSSSRYMHTMYRIQISFTQVKVLGKDIALAKLCEQSVINMKEKN